MSPLACCIRLVMYWTDVSKKFAHTKEEFKILFARECQAFLQHHWTSLVCQLRRAGTKVRHHPGWEQHQASSIEETSVSVSNSSFVTGKLHLSGLELQVMGGKKQRLKMMHGLLLFPVAEMYFFRCGNFLGCKAGLSLLLVFFLPRPVFFLPRTGFFPPRMVFSRCLQNAFFLLQRCFCAAARCFFCCFEFFPLRSGIFCWRFSAAEIAFSRCRAFFSCCQTCFFLLRTCVFRALCEDKELENVESYTGRSPLVSWIAHGQIGDKGDQSLKQPSANEKLKHAALDAATCFNGSGYKRERQKE